MLKWIRQFLLLQKFESISSMITLKLFEKEGNIELDKLIGQLTTSKAVCERLFIMELVIHIVDSIRNSTSAMGRTEAKQILGILCGRGGEAIEEQVRNKANLKLHQLRMYFEAGRNAVINEPASLDAMRYLIESDDKKPLSRKDLEALQRMAKVQDRVKGSR